MRIAVMLLFLSAALLAGVSLDASRRRRAFAGEDAVVLAVAARMPSSDLALSGGARWLRNPSLVEPSAPFDLGPAMLDPDPAGGLVAPPRGVWRDETPPSSEPSP
jgi:hypothetical protein